MEMGWMKKKICSFVHKLGTIVAYLYPDSCQNSVHKIYIL
jgi:hypothetical protein